MRGILILVMLATLCSHAKQKDKKVSLRDDLVAYWAFDKDPRRFSVWDKTHHQNNLTPHGWASEIETDNLVDGRIGDAIQTDGETQYFDIASNAGFSHQGDEFTFVMWFKPLTLANLKFLATTTEWGALIIEDSGSFYVQVTIEDEDITITSVPLVAGEWYFLALGWRVHESDPDLSVAWATINMEPPLTANQAGLTASAGPFAVAAGTGATAFVEGTFDDAAFWRRSLTAGELHELYNDGDGLPLSEWEPAACERGARCCN